ncbi:hypothetical protein C8J57DRAFT_1298515 [Mycena rebaudengoi]|nr:hypothetical protein C8J57DRAFT_1298515 [Mycena rebaudengoi]
MSIPAPGGRPRPVTSKARGICKYYATDRGCFAGRNCKFLHGDAKLTPYDQSKTCRFYAAGFCKRGAQCWFSHAKGKEKEVIEDEDDLCSICFEKPITYGLLTGCSHIFCITCIKEWRDPVNKSIDVVESGNTKRCPMCRQPSKFIIPSSKFFIQGQEEKDAALARYMDSMKRVPCKYFQKSLLSSPSAPFCPFGKDCFYQHHNLDGSEHILSRGVEECMRLYASHLTRRAGDFPISTVFPHRSELIRSLENVFAETRLGLNATRGFADNGPDEVAVMRRLELLADQMLASLAAGHGPHSEAESDSDDEDIVGMPPLERLIPRTEDWPLPRMFDSDSDADMPHLESVSNSSDDEDEDGNNVDSDSDSSSEDDNDDAQERIQTVRPFDLAFDVAMDPIRTETPSLFVRLSNLWITPDAEDSPLQSVAELNVEPVAGPSTLSNSQEEEEDESDAPQPERDPPFVTDGRGRVVWSSSSGTTSSSDARRGSTSSGIPGAFPSGPPPRTATPVEKPPTPRQPSGSGGFTTDGRGRVIGTTGARAEGDEGADPQGECEAPAPQARSFFGRVLDAFF